MKLLVMLSYLLDLVWSFDPVPDGTFTYDGSDRTSGLLKIVDDWINACSGHGSCSDTRSIIESTYGPIANWDTSGVTNMNYLFAYKTTFNANISEWDVSKVSSMAGSTFFIHLFSLQRPLSLLPFPHIFFFFCSKIFSLLLFSPLFFQVTV